GLATSEPRSPGRRPWPAWTQAMPLLGGSTRLVDDSLVATPIHLHHQRLIEAQLAYQTALVGSRLPGQPLPVHEPLADVGIDGEITDLERREVLEEVAALRRRDTKVTESRLDDDARPGDLVPAHRDAEPRVVGA